MLFEERVLLPETKSSVKTFNIDIFVFQIENYIVTKKRIESFLRFSSK